MAINVTFILAVIITLLAIYSGIKTGMVKSVTALIFIVATILMLVLGLYIYSNYKFGNGLRVVIAIVCLTILGAAFGVAKVVLKGLKSVAELPFVHLLDHILGAVVGAVNGILLIELSFVAAYHNYLGSFSAQMMNEISENWILKLLYQYNLFLG